METRVTASPKLFIGLDIHKSSWKIHCSTDLFAGKSFSMEPRAEILLQYVQKHFPDYQVSIAYEAGCFGYAAHREFTSYGWESLVVNPSNIHRKGKEQYTKTDRIDAQLISRELKDGRLESIAIVGEERECFRSLFRRRYSLSKDLRRIKSMIKMQLIYFGIQLPPEFDNDHWSHAFRHWLDAQEFSHGTARESLASKLRSFRFLDQEFRHVSNQLRAYARKHFTKDYYLLKSVPGIGGIVAAGILAELGDLRRFNTLKHLAGYVGMAPGIYQSGTTSRTTGMSPRAQRLMRSYFVEASWQAVRTDPVMQAYYRKHVGKDSKKIIIKIAHKLLSRTLAVIKTETPYEIGVLA